MPYQGPGRYRIFQTRDLFFPPEENGTDSGDWWASAELNCKYFSKRLDVGGADAIHAVIILIDVVHAFLQGREAHQGFSIYWLGPGDLSDLRLWGATPNTT